MAKKVVAREEVMSLLREGPGRIAAATGGVAPERLHARPTPEEWSTNEVPAYLRACADVWGGCIQRIATEEYRP